MQGSVLDLRWKGLKTQGCFSYCWTTLAQHQGFFCPAICPNNEEAGKRHSQDCWPHLAKGRSQYHTAPCPTRRTFRKGSWWEEHFELHHLLSCVIVMCDRALLFWRWLVGSSELISYFSWLVDTAFAFCNKLFLSQPVRFCPFTLPVHFPIPQWLCGPELGLNHEKLVDHNGHWPLLTFWRSIYTGSPEPLCLQ